MRLGRLLVIFLLRLVVVVVVGKGGGETRAGVRCSKQRAKTNGRSAQGATVVAMVAYGSVALTREQQRKHYIKSQVILGTSSRVAPELLSHCLSTIRVSHWLASVPAHAPAPGACTPPVRWTLTSQATSQPTPNGPGGKRARSRPSSRLATTRPRWTQRSAPRPSGRTR